MELRNAHQTDAAALSRIHAASWRAGYRGLVDQVYLDGIDDDRWTPLFHQWLTEDATKALLAENGQQAVGCIFYGPARDEQYPAYRPGWGEIISMYVLPGHWRCGYGRALMVEALERLRQAGMHGCFLWVLRENRRARDFYEAMGFSATEETLTVTLGSQVLVDVRYVLSF